MNKHTPGPWVLNEARSTRVDLIDTQRGHAVGEIVFVDVRNPADARLIAAAPELFDCLQRMMRHIHLEDFDSGAFSQDWAQACETIARATGATE